MWKCWVLVLCATGISSALVEPRNFSISPPPRHRVRNNRQNEPIRRFACPVGFFRLKRYCYYLSAGMAHWGEAHFHCKDRNATLAVLDRNGKDRMLRKYLMGDQFTKLERWIGGIFDWHQMSWKWGVTGDKMVFQNFGEIKPGKTDQYAWHCIVMDPNLKYKWTARKCVEGKHYVCEVPAGRIARRRKKTADPFAPQNQVLKPRKKGKKYQGDAQKPNRRNRVRPSWRREWVEHSPHQQWAHGVNLGSRPPSGAGRGGRRERMRHSSNRTLSALPGPRVAQILPQGREYGAFPGDGAARARNTPQSLSEMNNVLTEYHSRINDFAREEVLLKP